MRQFTIQDYLKKKILIKSPDIVKLSKKYLQKAKFNLITANILKDINNNPEIRKLLKVPDEYSSDEWVVVSSYYAMYASTLALLAKIGYKSSAHAATILALEHFFVKKEIINEEFLEMIQHARNYIDQHDVKELAEGKTNREIAQYSVTKATTHAIAETSMKNAYDFVNKARSIIEG